MSHQESNPKTRRDVFLTVALAVARDGMPEPKTLNLRWGTPHGNCVDLRFDSHANGHQWGKWIGDTGDGRWQEMPEQGVRTLSYWNTNGPLGCFWGVDAQEPLDALPVSSDLAEQVAAAILAPDADDLPADSKIWACPHEGCGYHIVDGPVAGPVAVADGSVPTEELIRQHLEEHAEPRCPDPECGEPLSLIEAGLVGHCGRGCGPELADAEVSA